MTIGVNSPIIIRLNWPLAAPPVRGKSSTEFDHLPATSANHQNPHDLPQKEIRPLRRRLRQTSNVHAVPQGAVRIPCSPQKDSLLRAEQGILRNGLISHREKADSFFKMVANRRKIQTFPVKFAVLREFGPAADGPNGAMPPASGALSLDHHGTPDSHSRH